MKLLSAIGDGLQFVKQQISLCRLKNTASYLRVFIYLFFLRQVQRDVSKPIRK